MRYLTRTLITLVMITLSTHSYSQCGMAAPLPCDVDGNSVVNIDDIDAISAAKGTPAAPGDIRDYDQDGMITVLDARQCATLCSSAECADALATCIGTEIQPERLFLQQLGADSVIIKWRGNSEGGAEAEKVCFGTDNNDLLRASKTFATVTAGGHREVLLSGLDADTEYYYSVGGAGVADPSHSFRTAPVTGSLPTDGNTRIWLIGDSGTGGDDEPTHAGEAAAVLAGMQSYIAGDGEDVEVFLMLGDNAYSHGTDFNHQQAVFEVYTALLKNVPVWPTIGNHEMGSAGISTSSDPDSYVGGLPGGEPSAMPYLDIFSLPTDGGVGGVASGTEQYYSFDYGNIHFVSLDSQLSARDTAQRDTMRLWLIDDLSSNTSDWTIVIFHHPPYSKGANHDSDVDRLGVDMPQTDMREEFVSVFDSYGVDLVYGGHSHSYERSYYLRNHTGTSGTFTTAAPELHAELVGGILTNPPASGRGAESYSQLSPTSGNVDDRVVYTVAGSSGKADSSSGFFTPAAEWLRHAAHIEQPADTVVPKRRGLNVLGSVIVDASSTSLTASFIDVNGVALDTFTINR